MCVCEINDDLMMVSVLHDASIKFVDIRHDQIIVEILNPSTNEDITQLLKITDNENFPLVLIRDWEGISLMNAQSGKAAIVVDSVALQYYDGNKLIVEEDEEGGVLLTTIAWEGEGS